MPQLLITGASGNVGREVVREGFAAGLSVRVAGSDPAALALQFPKVQAERFDFFDRGTWGKALAGCEGLFLMRPPAVSDVLATLCPLVDAAYQAGVKHIVFLSVAGADKMDWVPHRKVEKHLEQSGNRWTCLRPGFFAQNLQDAYRSDIVIDDRIYVPAGQGRIAFVDASDIAAVAVRIFANPAPYVGLFLTLTGGASMAFDEVAGILSQSVGRSITYHEASILGYVWHLWRRRKNPLMQAIIQTFLHVGLRKGDAERIDPTVEQILGRKPRTMAEYTRDNRDLWVRQ